MNDIIGLKELESKLMRLEEIARDSVQKAGNLVRNSAVMLSPTNRGELRQSIFLDVDGLKATVYTNKEYAPYVEFGTGPVGAANHSGIAPDANPTYSPDAWWIHESQVDVRDALKYQWFYIDTDDGRFYMTSGQPAKPFMYPALKDNEDNIIKIFNRDFEGALK